jgi:hypothetical protein
MTMTAKKQMVTDDVEQWLDSLGVDPAEAHDGRHMRRISAAAEALDAAHDELHAAVKAARLAGDTWSMIGTALGTTRQAAFQRFGQTTADDRASGQVAIERDLDRPRGPRKSVLVAENLGGRAMPQKRAGKKAAPRKQPTQKAAAAKGHKRRNG